MSSSLVFKVVEFALEDGFDFVRFYLGDHPAITVFKLTGTDIKIRRLVYKGSVSVTFTSDLSGAHRGFFFLIHHLDVDKEGKLFEVSKPRGC